MRTMDTAPHDGIAIVILTAVAAHRAEWDSVFGNFWSTTAARAIDEEEALGWMSMTEWQSFVLQSSPGVKLREPQR